MKTRNCIHVGERDTGGVGGLHSTVNERIPSHRFRPKAVVKVAPAADPTAGPAAGPAAWSSGQGSPILSLGNRFRIPV